MNDVSTDTMTPATDREVVEIATKARAGTVLHWPELIRVINRLRKAEEEIERLRKTIDDMEAEYSEIGNWKQREIERLRKERDEYFAEIGRRQADYDYAHGVLEMIAEGYGSAVEIAKRYLAEVERSLKEKSDE